MLSYLSLTVIAGRVSAPGRSGFSSDSSRALVVVAERLGDHRWGCLENELSDSGGATSLHWDADFP
jgi:hypothetical protein